jgi:hypothetical protein
MGTGGPFPGGKAWPGRDANHSPPSSAEVKNEQELYLLSPHAPQWRIAGSLYLYIYVMVVPPLHIGYLLVRKHEGKRSFGGLACGSRIMLRRIIRMSGDVDWIQLAQGRIRRQAVVNTVMNLRVP